jgi:hypothetical protein
MNLNTKMAISKWIKQTFKTKNDFENFLNFAELHSCVLDGKQLLPTYQQQYNNLKNQYSNIYKTIVDMPLFTITERYGKMVEQEQRTPLNYIEMKYGTDEKLRTALYKR